jgi:hypothetical protein
MRRMETRNLLGVRIRRMFEVTACGEENRGIRGKNRIKLGSEGKRIAGKQVHREEETVQQVQTGSRMSQFTARLWPHAHNRLKKNDQRRETSTTTFLEMQSNSRE